MSTQQDLEGPGQLPTHPVNESMTPILPCGDADRTVAFYEALGFTLHHRQDKPYPYIALSWRGISVHFSRVPAGVDGTREDFACLIAVDDLTPYHHHLAARLRDFIGRVPTSGRPRLTRFRPGASRFTLVDPDGNNLIFVRRDEPKTLDYGGSPDLTGLAKTLDGARILRDYRGDSRSAFRSLDSALRRPKPDDQREDRATALAWMIELATDADAEERLPGLVEALQGMQLTETELGAALSALSDPSQIRRLHDGRP